MLWLKRWIVPTLLHEVLATDIVYPAILQAHGRPLGLLLATMSYLQSGLRVLTLSFCRVEIMKDDKDNAILDKMVNWRILVLSCCTPLGGLVRHTVSNTYVSGAGVNREFRSFHLEAWTLKMARWLHSAIRRIVQSSMNYYLFRCFCRRDTGLVLLHGRIYWCYLQPSTENFLLLHHS